MSIDRLKQAMERSHVDQSGLAARIGCTPGAINQIMTGRTKRSKLLPEIAHTLGVSLPWLIGRSDDPDPNVAGDLSPDEAQLLVIYRHLPEEDRETLRRLVDRLASTSGSSDQQSTGERARAATDD